MTIYNGKVIGRFVVVAPDSDDADTDPDLVALKGVVTFTPAVDKVLGATEQIFPVVVKAHLDSEGYLTYKGERGVYLLSPESDINPSDWTWTVSFDLKHGNTEIDVDSFSISLPPYVAGPNAENPDVGSTAVDLAAVSPIPSSPGNAITKGDPGDSAYDVAVANGFVGTEAEWLASLEGPAGTTSWTGITDKPELYTETEVDALLDLKSDVIYEVDLRTPSTSSTDYKDVEIQQAFSGVKARIGPGEWHIQGEINVNSGCDVTLDGATIICHGTSWTFTQYGSTPDSGRQPRAITAGTNSGSLSITTDATDISVGDWILIRSQDLQPNLTTNTTGMLRQVTSVDGNVVGIDIPLYRSIATSPVCVKVDLAPQFKLDGNGIIKHASPSSIFRSLVRVVLGDSPYVGTGITIGPSGGPALQFEHCVNAVSRASFVDLMDGDGHLGYGVNDGGCSRNTHVLGGTARRVRHGFTTNHTNYVVHESIPAGDYGEPEDFYVGQGYTVISSTSAAFDTHEPGRRGVIEVNAINCDSGAQDRATDSVFDIKVIDSPNLYGIHIANSSSGSVWVSPKVTNPKPATASGPALIRARANATIFTPLCSSVATNWQGINATDGAVLTIVGGGTIAGTKTTNSYVLAAADASGTHDGSTQTDIRTALASYGIIPSSGNLNLTLGGSMTGTSFTGTGTVQSRLLRAISTAISDVPLRSDGISGATGDLAQFRVNGVTRHSFTAAGDVSLPTAGRGLELKSPDSTVKKVTLDNTGSLSVGGELLDARYSSKTHAHPISEVTNLQTTLDGKAPLSDQIVYSWEGVEGDSKSFETGSSGVLRQNIATNPMPYYMTSYAGKIQWLTIRHFGPGGGAGTHQIVSGSTPVGNSFIRKTWTTAPTSPSDTGFDHMTNPLESYPATPGQTYTFSSYLRTSASGKFGNIRIFFYNSAGTLLSSSLGTAVELIPNQWHRISHTATTPANTAFVRPISDIRGSLSTNWQVADTLDGCGLLGELSSSLGGYFDGNSTSQTLLTNQIKAVGDKSYSPLQRFAELFLDSSVTTDLLNYWLSIPSPTGIKKLSGEHTATKQIKIPSNTYLDLGETKIIRAHNSGGNGGGTIVNTDQVNGNENITITGGYLSVADGFTGKHFGLVKVNNLRIRHNTITSLAGDFMAVLKNCNNVQITGLRWGGSFGHGEDGLHLYGGTGYIISDCQIQSGDDALAITNETADNDALQYIEVTNCVFGSTYASGIKIHKKVEAPYPVKHVHISNVSINTPIDPTNRSAIRFLDDNVNDDGIYDVTLSNVIINNYNIDGNGIRSAGVDQLTLENITLWGIKGVPIYVTGGTNVTVQKHKDLVIRNIRVMEQTLAGANSILVEDAIGFDVVGSYVKNAKAHSIRIIDSISGNVSGNRVEVGDQSGIRLETTTRTRVHSNLVTGMTSVAISEGTGSTENNFALNDMRDNGTNSVTLASGSTSVIAISP